MRLNLKSEPAVPYSAKEKWIIEQIARQRQSTKQLLNAYYAEQSSVVPFNGQVIMNSAMRSLTTKVARNKESFRVKRTAMRGPHPMEFWVEEILVATKVKKAK